MSVQRPIPLTKGKVAFVSPEDFRTAIKLKWCVHERHNRACYAQANIAAGSDPTLTQAAKICNFFGCRMSAVWPEITTDAATAQAIPDGEPTANGTPTTTPPTPKRKPS